MNNSKSFPQYFPQYSPRLCGLGHEAAEYFHDGGGSGADLEECRGPPRDRAHEPPSWLLHKRGSLSVSYEDN